MKWIALLSLLAASVLRQPAPEVRTRSGRVRGRVAENGRFYEYLGIPYATVDERNRFQAPLPPPSWDGVFEAQNENSWCPQAALVSSIVIGQPDCLKLNIYVPVRASEAPLSVMVFIHGGCFFGGSGSPFLYGGDYFAEQGVIFVGINYRLSVEGFLCLGIKEAPGNAGLKDQLAALRWIRDNISAFGGNKDDITLFGESAGAVSTSLMLLSESAKGLFHKAILQSGSSLSSWAMQHDPIETANRLVKKLGYNSTSPREIYKILSRKTAQELVSVLKYNEDKYCVSDEHMFVPCVEKAIRGVEPIITQHPAAIIEAGNFTKMPMIIGHTDKEGIYFVATDYGTSIDNDSEKTDILKTLQPDLDFPSELEKNNTIEKVKRHYFSSNQDEMIMDVVDLYSDVHFKVPVLLEAEMFSKRTDQSMYYYLFRYSGLINMPKIISGFWRDAGASHADELFYMFKPHAFPLPRFWENDMVKRMVMLWTNFAKFGDPTPKATPLVPFRWRPSREANPTALVIDSRPTTAPLWDKSSLTLWNETYNRYRKKDYGFKKNIMQFTKSMDFGSVN